MMKNNIFFINTLVISVLIFCSNVYAEQTWQLYDDFSATTIDTSKWSIVDDSSAIITIENGRAKFVHKVGYASDSSWLAFSKMKAGMSGIKGTITVESCSADSDVQARIGGFIGTVGSNLAWMQQTIRPFEQTIVASISVLDPAPPNEFKYDYFWGNYKKPLEVVAVPFTLSAIFFSSNTRHIVDSHGELEYSFPSDMGPVAENQNFIGIGTESDNGTGTCTVYFDNIYILADEQISVIPATSLLLNGKKK